MHFSAQDIIAVIAALGVFVSGPLLLLVRELRVNTKATVDASAANVESRTTETAKVTSALVDQTIAADASASPVTVNVASPAAVVDAPKPAKP